MTHKEAKGEATKVRRPGKRQYETAALEMRLSYAPIVYPCMKCGWPVREGFCCPTCDDNNPSEAASSRAGGKE